MRGKISEKTNKWGRLASNFRIKTFKAGIVIEEGWRLENRGHQWKSNVAGLLLSRWGSVPVEFGADSVLLEYQNLWIWVVVLLERREGGGGGCHH